MQCTWKSIAAASLLLPGCEGWVSSGRQWCATSRRHATPDSPTSDFAAWEKVALEDHEKECAAAKDRYGFVRPGGGESKLAYDGGWDAREVGSTSLLGLDNAPFTAPGEAATRALVQVSSAPLLTEGECEAFVAAAEKRGAEAGWGSRYTYQGASHEVHVADLPVARTILRTLLESSLLPAVASVHPHLGAEGFRVYNALVVKYDAASGRVAMPAHGDFGCLTLNVALTRPGVDYSGGGTWFQALAGDGGSSGGSSGVIDPPRGHGVLHAASLVHAGCPVEAGARYQLVVFLVHESEPDVAGRLQHLGAGMLKRGDAAGAAEVLGHAVSANALDAEAWYQLGRARSAAGDAAGSLEAMRTCCALGDAGGSPSFGAHFARASGLAAAAVAAAAEMAGAPAGEKAGEAAAETAETVEALREAAAVAWERCLAIGAPPGPDKAAREMDVGHNWGLALLTLGRHEDAGLAFEAVVDEDPSAVESWAGLGVCMAKLGMEDAALACQRQVLAIREQGKATEATEASEGTEGGGLVVE